MENIWSFHMERY